LNYNANEKLSRCLLYFILYAKDHFTSPEGRAGVMHVVLTALRTYAVPFDTLSEGNPVELSASYYSIFIYIKCKIIRKDTVDSWLSPQQRINLFSDSENKLIHC